MEGSGLPAQLENEPYSYFLEDSMGRFNITVPAVEVTPGRVYTCDIRNESIAYDGFQSSKYGRNVTSIYYNTCILLQWLTSALQVLLFLLTHEATPSSSSSAMLLTSEEKISECIPGDG